MPPSTAASLPLASEQPETRRPIAVAAATEAGPQAPAGPDRVVECGFCHTSGLASQMTSIGGGQYRCDLQRPEGAGCVQRNIRWRETGAKPAPILSSPLEPLPRRVPAVVPEAVPVLPPAQEATLTAFNKASDEQDAAEAGQARAEDEEPAEATEEPPASDGDGAEPDAAPAVAEGSEPAETPGEAR